jgi:surfeit locus 1 family protein
MMQQPPGPADHDAPRRRSAGLRFFVLAIGSLLCAGFFALGTWQVQRLQWKLALIERVQQRVHAAPVAAPAPGDWPRVSAESDEYRHVRVSGVYLFDLTARVQASTVLGSGYWLMTPMCRDDGSIVVVNRGFVAGGGQGDGQAGRSSAAAASCAAARARGEATTVTGLLRISEPNGGFLRHNEPAANRWYSRDVQAIAASRQLSPVAPYFVDADATPSASADAPVGGLTVVSFHNNHLVYAVTWYALALMVAGACYWLVRYERKLRKNGDDG